jgi:hypothetical protein
LLFFGAACAVPINNDLNYFSAMAKMANRTRGAR